MQAIEGWNWWLSVADRWERNYAALVKFHEREGHVRPPQGHFEDDVSLWRWVRYQRLRYADGKLLRYPDRIARLEAIPGWEWQEIERRPADAA